MASSTKKGMSSNKKRKPGSSSNKTFKILNKQSREKYNVRFKVATSAARRKLRIDRKREEEKHPELREERLRNNVPATLDRKRVWEEVDVERVKNATNKWPVVPVEVLEESLREEEKKEKGEKRVRKKRKVETDEDDDDDDRWLKRMGEDKEGDGEDGESWSESEVEGDEKNDEEDEKMDMGNHEKRDVGKKGIESDVQTTTSTPTWASLLVPPNTEPRLLITTSRNSHMHEPAQELADIFGPSATYIPRGRKKFSIKQICEWALDPPQAHSSNNDKEIHQKPYTHVLVVNDHHKIPNKLTIIRLPAGPSFHFSLTNFASASKIRNHGNPTSHSPELILNNFLTPLGKLTASLFQSIFPPQPEFKGRQVVTLHNQRDYIFFRRHRYVFRDKKGREKGVGYGLDYGPGSANPVGKEPDGGDLGIKVGLQELGPRFTLKLRRVERGVKEEVEWEWKGAMEKNRRLFQL